MFSALISVRMIKTKAEEQTGTKILLDMSKDEVHLARFFLDGGVVDPRSDGAQTPLISSVLLPDAHARCKFTELLLQEGASANQQDPDGRTALSFACERSFLDAVKILVRNGADPEIQDRWGNSALMFAAAAGHASVLEFLVRAFKRLGLHVHRAGNSAAAVASFLGHSECVLALTVSNRSREAGGGAQPTRALEEELEKKVDHLRNKLEGLRARDLALMVRNPTWKPRPRAQNRLRSMDSESEGVSFPAGAPPQVLKRTSKLNSKQLLGGHLPPLLKSSGVHKPFLSPQPDTPSSSALEVLLTPILTRTPGRGPAPELGATYFKKRCSLPTSALSPAPPERAALPGSKFRPVRRREEEAPTSTSSTLSALSSKLLRRFTSPEFQKEHRDPEQTPISGGLPRSETFPLTARHAHVHSTPSVHSISSVKCEFDSHLTNPNCSE